jgi:hypothetical protein
VTYFVHVDCTPPAVAVPLDPLQRAGAAHVFGNLLENLEGIEGPDGLVVEVTSTWVGAHPEGARLLLALEAPALEFAEAAARAVVEEILDAAEELDDWSVATCGVELHDELARQSLAAAEGLNAPPSDLSERARRLRPIEREEHDEDFADDGSELDEATLRALAGRLCHGLDAFGYSAKQDDGEPRKAAELAAGAVVYAMDILTDELFADLVELAKDDTDLSVEESDSVFFVLELLPEAFAAQYRPDFVRRFILATAAMVQRLTSSSWSGLVSTAEELAFRLLLDEAVPVLEMCDAYDDATRAALATYKAYVFDDYDHEWLFEADLDDELGSVMAWFQPFRPDLHVHPYTLDDGS